MIQRMWGRTGFGDNTLVSILLFGLLLAGVASSADGSEPTDPCLYFGSRSPCPVEGDDVLVAEVGGWSVHGLDLRRLPSFKYTHHRVNERDQQEHLAAVVERFVLLQEALRRGLDDDPDVRRAGELAILTTEVYPGMRAIEPTEQDIADYYHRHQTRYVVQGYNQVQDIVVPHAGGCSEADSEVEAVGMRAALRKEPGLFDQLSDRETRCTPAGTGGRFHLFRPPESGEPATVREWAREADLGEVSRIVMLEDGLHVYRLNDRRERRQLSMDQATHKVRMDIRSEWARARIADLAMEGRSELAITIDQDVLTGHTFGDDAPAQLLGWVEDIGLTTRDLDLMAHGVGVREEPVDDARRQELLERLMDVTVLFWERRERLLRESVGVQNALLARLLVDDRSWRSPEPAFTEFEVHEFCAEHPEVLEGPRRIYVDRLLLVKAEGESESEFSHRVDVLDAELESNPSRFRQLAVTHSQCPLWTILRGGATASAPYPLSRFVTEPSGRIGPVTQGGALHLWACDGIDLHPVHLSAAEVDTIVALNEHQVSDPVRERDRVAWFRSDRVWDAYQTDCEAIRESVLDRLANEELSRRRRELLVEPVLAPLLESATITVHEDALHNVPRWLPPRCCGEGCHGLR